VVFRAHSLGYTCEKQVLLYFIPFKSSQLSHRLLFGALQSMLSKDTHLSTHIEVGLVYLTCVQM
jgi:hypothetical protein